MTQRMFPFAHGEFYHVYNRGTDKRTIFLDIADYRRFIELLFLSNSVFSVDVRYVRKFNDSVFDFDRSDPLVYIGAYCLMPNHFHILLTPAIENGVQMFMQKLLTGYSMYFNKRYERTGALFESRFKARHANSNEYLKYLFSYIHLNPVKLIQSDWKESGIRDIERVKQYLDTYEYSSFKDYFSSRTESAIMEPSKFPDYFSNKKGIDTELLSWLAYAEIVELEQNLQKT
jgi:putative transposase